MDDVKPTVAAAQHSPAGREVVSPVPLMPDYFGSEDEKRQFLAEIFDAGAADYDRMERLLGLGSGSWYRRSALRRAGLGPGQQVVDVAVGTGLVAREAVRLVGEAGRVIGIDPSPGMLAHAKVPACVRLVEGRAEAIPLGDASADFLSMGYALRHISDLAAAFGEFHRVLRPGGRLCILEITAPRTRLGRFCARAYMRTLIPTLGRFVARSRDTARLWRFYWDTIEACIPPQAVLDNLEACGFVEVQRHASLGICSEYRATRG